MIKKKIDTIMDLMREIDDKLPIHFEVTGNTIKVESAYYISSEEFNKIVNMLKERFNIEKGIFEFTVLL